MTGKKQALFIGDPWNTLDHARDSSLYLTEYARTHFGITSYWTTAQNIYFEEDSLWVLNPIEIQNKNLGKTLPNKIRLSSFKTVHIRTDPPVNIETIRFWSLLANSREKIRLINKPTGLLKWNEKFSPLFFPHWHHPTCVAENANRWEVFFEKYKHHGVIAKPAGDAASRGVELLPPSWKKAFSILKEMREKYGGWLVLQKVDKNIFTQGETRVFLLNGRYAGTLHKAFPNRKKENPIISFDRHGQIPQVKEIKPSPVQLERAKAVAKLLKQDGIVLATIDFIGDRILEINVTSPGLIQHVFGLAHRYWKEIHK